MLSLFQGPPNFSWHRAPQKLDTALDEKNIQDKDKTIKNLKRHMQSATFPRGIKQPDLKKLYDLFHYQKRVIFNDGLVVKK